ncbi:hypothetical protein ACEWY4_000213 [Coilia grayii]|uniref:Zinc finger PHD-type domain-containing protein n=1 Tax=Coilia grayii TaxID=363190 RepID=A0ABD1KW03_9TELE
MCYPPHTTHEMQPADKALFKSLKHHWNVAWAKAAMVENAQAGFPATGMFPLNKNIIPEASYAPSKTTERAPPTTLASTFIRPQSLPLLPTEPVLPPVALTPASLLSEHQTIHPPATPQSPAVKLARPEPTDLLTPLLPVEHLYFFSDEVEEVLLEEIAEEDTGLFHVFTPQDEAHSLDEGPSSSTSTCYKGRGPSEREENHHPYHLTSDEHIEYIKTKKSSKKPAKSANNLGCKQPKGKKKTKSVSLCKAYKAQYGDRRDPKVTEEWIKCGPCFAWFHESCGELNGICDDDGFICKDCL